MATYAELFELRVNSELKNKITVAIIVAAESIRSETTPTAPRLAWAKGAFENPAAEADRMMMAILAANKDATPAAITGAADAAIQTQVDEAVNVFAGS